MKTKLSLRLLLILALSPAPCALSQIPQGFNYQAVAHTTTGGPMANTTIQVKMGILSDTITPVVTYEELHSTVKTNVNGVFNIVIGTGVRQSGSAASFSQINWNVTPLYLKVQINYQGIWKTMGNAKLWSVPYSMIAGDLAGSIKKLSVAGQTSVNDEALFEVKNKIGQTVFAVYNEGVRVYVSDGAKGLKGGFAVGGFGTDKGVSTPYFVVGKDSVRVYLDTNPLTKGLKGGFAVGGYDLTKGTVQDYLDVNSDSVRIYIDSNPSTKGLKGGFAVGGYDMTKGDLSKYLRVTPDSTRILTADTLKGFGVGNVLSGAAKGYLRLTPSNYLIGHQAGKSITTGLYNSVIGYQSGYKITSGNSNSFIGFKAGYTNTSGHNNVFLGNNAGYSNNGSMNTFIGYISGMNNITGYYNTFVGDSAGYSNTTGHNNTFLGGRAGSGNTVGYWNTYVGSQAGFRIKYGYRNTCVGSFSNFGGIDSYASDNTIVGYAAGGQNNANRNTFVGSYAGQSQNNNMVPVENVFVGYMSGSSNITGKLNTFIGSESGIANTTGYSNVMIGYMAGKKNTAGQDNVIIGGEAGSGNVDGYCNVIIGAYTAGANVSGDYNTFLGYWAGPSTGNLTNATAIGYNARVNASNKIVMGDMFVTSIGGYAGWSNYSDRRMKENIIYKNNLGLNFISRLNTVSFNYITDSNKRRRDGLIAQDVLQVLKDLNLEFSGLVIDDNDEQTLNLSYGEFVIPLINAVQELNKKDNEHKNLIESQQKQIDELKVLVNSIIANQTAKVVNQPGK